ncbi:MAG: aminoglycoside phosphotransferase family protein [Cytophagales bacterium]|nr:aminoglycoside phosphotransferase family protein [Armatimonadota bacterium]
MRQKPNISDDALIDCLRDYYRLDVVSVRYLPIGYDLNAFVYQTTTKEGLSYFVKVRIGTVPPQSLIVPQFLTEQGVPNVLPPLRTTTQSLWSSFESYSVVVYPFIRGENAMVAGLSDAQWQEFGTTLRAIHTNEFARLLKGQIPAETFTLPSAALVRRLTDQIKEIRVESPAAARLASFWTQHLPLIKNLLTRAETLGRQLQTWHFEYVLCHADIHAANILVSEDSRIYLIDWDGPIIAPKERDLLFVVGSKIARTVTPREEALFFQGYGAVEINIPALTYYRCERAIEDIGEFGKSVFFDTDQSEEAKAEEASLFVSLFDPSQIVEMAMRAD